MVGREFAGNGVSSDAFESAADFGAFVYALAVGIARWPCGTDSGRRFSLLTATTATTQPSATNIMKAQKSPSRFILDSNAAVHRLTGLKPPC
jgi:hypothetical protein